MDQLMLNIIGFMTGVIIGLLIIEIYDQGDNE